MKQKIIKICVDCWQTNRLGTMLRAIMDIETNGYNASVKN